ncbi:urocanate hydratase isoform X2 [Cherax quadricarinatus]|uniref:urocanate hydratase isoform X2 n=1 Tax=Cherax quadricarinatus TaxID=27406 RepID=UPI00387E9832
MTTLTLTTCSLPAVKVGTVRPVLTLVDLCSGLPVNPLPPPKSRDPSLPHAPVRTHNLSREQQQIAVTNALRYFPEKTHSVLAPEFTEELRLYGHIYMYRFLPNIQMRAYPLAEYPARSNKAAAIMHMIMNNLDPQVAQFPQELVTYGGNGQVFSNWAQVWLVLHYLSVMMEDQTLVLYSGHPLGLFPSDPRSPRLVITNGMVIPSYSTRVNYDDMFAMGVTMYGQMTAGSYCYIGPQGIVHGTTVNKEALNKRYQQGWLEEYTDDLDVLIKRVREARAKKQVTSIGYQGNVVEVWERLVKEYETTGDLLVDLGSDQTSCHNPFSGGYCPVQLTFDEAEQMLAKEPEKFRPLVEESLRRQVAAINKLADAGLFFWDYGNAFLLEARRAGADVGCAKGGDEIKFRYPSYVQDIMGDIFSLGFGPFRWVCTSGDPQDLQKTDELACTILKAICNEGISERTRQQYQDNIAWIEQAGKHKLVVGSQARILYSDQVGRVRIARAFNDAVRAGLLKAAVVISRDHHDVSGTDSPFRETSNVYDGSAFTADMAVQNFVGDAFRGATWVALHNGGGVGWGEVINGGFGLVLDGSEEAQYRASLTLNWDVSNGVARRAWSGNENAEATIIRSMTLDHRLKVTIPHHADPTLVAHVLATYQ